MNLKCTRCLFHYPYNIYQQMKFNIITRAQHSTNSHRVYFPCIIYCIRARVKNHTLGTCMGGGCVCVCGKAGCDTKLVLL